MTLDKQDDIDDIQDLDRIAPLVTIPPEVAREIMGPNNYCGPEAVAKTWGRILRTEEIPPIPFSEKDLKRAAELDQFLILRVDKAGDGRKLSMRNQSALLAERFRREKKGKVFFYAQYWRKDKELFSRSTPMPQWALVTKEIIPESGDRDAWCQALNIIVYIRNSVFRGQELPPESALAKEEYFSSLNKISMLRQYLKGLLISRTGVPLEDRRRELTERLVALRINQLYRRTPVEALFDSLTYFDNTGHRLLENTYDRTMYRFIPDEDAGNIDTIIIGNFRPEGIDVYFWDPLQHQPGVGVIFSRTR